MKKIGIAFLILLLPIMVLGEECKEKNLLIESIEAVTTEGNIEELGEASIEDNTLILNLKMVEEGDLIEYKLLLKNNSTSNYEIKDIKLPKSSQYIKYSLETEGKDTIIKPGKEQEVYLRVQYIKEVEESSFENGQFHEDQTIVMNVMGEVMNNPFTGTNLLIIGMIILILLGIGYIIVLKKQNKEFLIIILALGLLLPITTKALCMLALNIESHIVIEKKTTFHLKIANCDSQTSSWIDDDYEFEEGMTIKEWVESPYIQKLIDTKKEENPMDPETSETDIEAFEREIRNKTLLLIVRNITNDENYVIQKGDNFELNKVYCK